MLAYKYTLMFLVALFLGTTNLSAAGLKVYEPPKVCDCETCVCKVCECSVSEVAAPEVKAPKTEKVKAKYLTYTEGVKALEKSKGDVVLITYVGVEPKAYPYYNGKDTIVCKEDKLDGYKKGDVIVSGMFGGNHERIALNDVEDKTAHTGVVTSTPVVTYVKSCNGSTCTMVPVYSQPVTTAPNVQYYFPGGCSTGNCPR